MSHGGDRTRLVSFLGLGPPHSDPPHYTPARYEHEGARSTETPLIQAALSELLKPEDVRLLGTQQVKQRWIDTGLATQYLDAHLLDDEKPLDLVPLGATQHELREIFNTFVDALGLHEAPDRAPTRLIIDVTHGFRVQPIIALSALAFASSEWARSRRPAPEIQVLYGAFEAARDGVAPIWDLTEVVLVARWNAALDALVRYGRADDLEQLADAQTRHALRAAREAGRSGSELRGAGALRRLGTASRNFADDVATGRLKNVLTTSAKNLQRQLSSDDVADWTTRLPVLKGSFGALQESLAPLQAPCLFDTEGVRASIAFGAYCFRTERFAEAAAAYREAVYTLLGGALGVTAPREGTEKMSAYRRELDNKVGEVIQRLSKKESIDDLLCHPNPSIGELVPLAQKLATLRNDIEHVGLNDSARSAESLRNELDELGRALHEHAQSLPNAT